MWQLLMGQTDKIFGKSYGGQWVNVVNDLQQVLQDGAQTMSQIMKENSAALQWKQLIVQTIREAQKELALAEGHARLKASEVCELQNTVYNVQQQLEKSDERRTAAEAAFIELVPLHLTVSQLRQRLAAEMTALHELQEKHAVTGALAEKHRAEATAFASDKADLTGKIMALRGDMHMKESELSLAKRRADLAESTQQLDRDEIKRLKRDMYKLQDELAADLEYTSKLELKRKMLEDEVESLGEKLACITVSESALRTQKSQAEENVEKLRESLESEMQGRVAAESLVAEYEAGIERRMRKLESEIQAKDSRIQLLEEDVKNGIKAQAAERARAAETEEASRIAYMQLAASLEVKVLERVKDQTMEIAALNDMVKQARETQSQYQEKHNTQMGSLRASSQEKVMKANQAAAAAEQACLQLQKSASTQIADANKQCHQSEAKSQAVERKLEHQGRAFKMRILTLEATIKDLKQTIADLCGQNHSQEQELTAKLEELDVSQAKERILLRELEHANEKLLHQESEIDRLGGEVAAVRNQMKIEVAARQDVAKQRSAAVEELRALLKAEQEKVFEAGEKIQQLEYASSDVSNVLVQNKQQAQELAHMREETKLLRAQYEALNLEKDSSHTAQAALKAKVRELSECVEMLSAVKVELEQKLPMLEEEGICQDDDSAEGEEGSRPSSRQGSRPPSHHSVGKRAHSAGSAGSQSPPLLPPIVRTRQSRSMTTGLRSPKAIGQYTPRASTYLPVKQIDDGIWIDKAYMPSGWTIEQGILMVPDALLVSSEQHQRVLQEQRQSMEYMEAHAALEAVKWACIQSERRLNGDPVATVHVTQPLTGTQKTLPRGDTQARVPKNHDQQASTTQSSCSLPRDASQLELRQPHRKDHGNSAVVAEQEQISVVGSAPVARPS